MPYPGYRRLTITLTIVVIVAHPSCGFTLHRKTTAEAIPDPTTDLALQESLQVKNIKRPNDITQHKDADTKIPTKDKHRFTSELKIMDTTEDPSESIHRITSELNITDTTESMLDTTITDVTTNQYVVTKKNEEPEVTATNSVVESTTQEMKTLSEITTTTKSELVENITQSIQNTHPPNNFKTSTITKIKPTQSEPEVISTTDLINLNDQIAIDSEATKNILSQKETNTIVTTINTITENTVTETPTSFKNPTSSNPSSEVNEKPNITITTEAATNVLLSKADLSESQDDISKSASTVVEVKITNDLSLTTTEPTWKKYTTIERKRGGSSDETSTSNTEREDDSSKAESIQTTLPIPSLEMMREDLIFNANHLSTVNEPQTGSITTKSEPVSTLESIVNTQSDTMGTIESKRGGFLDSSKRTSVNQEETKTERNVDYRTIYEIEATDIEAHDIKKLNGYESLSQLAEDAIKEELLKEESINNHDENKRYEDGKDNVKLATTTSLQSITEDTLSVQPINQDRRTTLYTVGPNYKPMKRIEVQPAKPFVRDPDDNSWRNESISSLGIVFKPKNSSSKSFKEVLKTKTETEFNNLQDKENKNDTPELRERLEKIAEVRKSKKKRVNKFGEVVYTDYEEGSSAEGINIPKSETTTTKINSPDVPITTTTQFPETEVTSLMTTTESERYWKNALETTNKEEMLRDLGLDILTTVKTKKPYNLAEYYDTTDEYDADYANQQKIDLKKFTIPFEPKFPPQTSPQMPLLTTKPTLQFPERKPTVQYFPPTTKPQKVNVNDYDVGFERRVQYYTLKETPKTNTPFDDVATLEVATDRPDIRPTVKPSDFTMFTPQPPDSLDKHMYMTNDPRVTEPQNFVVNDGNFRGTYVIKHYRDFLNEAAREEEDDRTTDFVLHTKAPGRNTSPELTTPADDRGKTSEADYEYDSQFRKHVLSRFVDNFNQNSDRFKVDFPVLFNTSVIHRSNDDQGRVLASSSTFMKRLYGNQLTRAPQARACEPNCDITVELSPAYELHYYVPEQEEKEVMEQRSATMADQYKL